MKKKIRLKHVIRNEAMHWGDAAAEAYFDKAEPEMEQQWEGIIDPFISNSYNDNEVVLDLAAGRGRNTAKLLEYFKKVIVLDVNPENIKYCKKRFSHTRNVRFILNNGLSFKGVRDDTVSLVYCFDAMVHFDMEVVLEYLNETKRVLKNEGVGFFHHSNFTDNPGGDFEKNVHWRNFMSKSLFKHLAIKSGLQVIKQEIISWGGIPNLDCLTLVKNNNKM